MIFGKHKNRIIRKCFNKVVKYMPETFCPFIKGNCNHDCIFFDKKCRDKEQCQIFKAVKTVNMYVYNIDSVDSGISDVCSKLDNITQTLENHLK